MATRPENWTSANTYERFMGRWSAEVAIRFMEYLAIPSEQVWLDIGCGTGALTRTILAHQNPKMLVGLEPSINFVQYAAQHINKARFLVADGVLLPIGECKFDVIVSGLALNFMPKPEQALSEMYRITKSGGTVAAYVWDYAGKMEFLRYFWDAAVELDSDAKLLHEGSRFPLCQAEPLQQLWQSTGFNDVSVDTLDIPTIFPSFDAYWQPFTLGNFPAPQYAMSLDETRLNRLRDLLQKNVPVAADGSIHLAARVWAVRGIR